MGDPAPGVGHGARIQKIAFKRMCPQVLADPEGYDDKLVVLCQRALHL